MFFFYLTALKGSSSVYELFGQLLQKDPSPPWLNKSVHTAIQALIPSNLFSNCYFLVTSSKRVLLVAEPKSFPVLEYLPLFYTQVFLSYGICYYRFLIFSNTSGRKLFLQYSWIMTSENVETSSVFHHRKYNIAIFLSRRKESSLI